MKSYRDLKNAIDAAREEAKIEGKIEMVKKMINSGVPVEKIIKRV